MISVFPPVTDPFLMHLQAYQRLQLQQQMLQAQRNVSGPMRQQEQQVGQTCLSLSSSACTLECWFWLPTATDVWLGSVIALGANHLFSRKCSCDLHFINLPSGKQACYRQEINESASFWDRLLLCLKLGIHIAVGRISILLTAVSPNSLNINLCSDQHHICIVFGIYWSFHLLGSR